MVGKVKLKFITNANRRNVTYKKRKEGLMKKAEELSVVCNLSVALICISIAGAVDTWPDDPQQVRDTIARYQALSQVKRDKHKSDLISYLTSEATEPHIQRLGGLAQNCAKKMDAARQRIELLSRFREPDRADDQSTNAENATNQYNTKHGSKENDTVDETAPNHPVPQEAVEPVPAAVPSQQHHQNVQYFYMLPFGYPFPPPPCGSTDAKCAYAAAAPSATHQTPPTVCMQHMVAFQQPVPSALPPSEHSGWPQVTHDLNLSLSIGDKVEKSGNGGVDDGRASGGDHDGGVDNMLSLSLPAADKVDMIRGEHSDNGGEHTKEG